jgi:hypothetical protein
MTSPRKLAAFAAAAALAAATPAYALLTHKALVPVTPIGSALAAVGAALSDLNRVAIEGTAVPDGAGGVLEADGGETAMR